MFLVANRRLNEILIRDDGFSKNEITISEGEVILNFFQTLTSYIFKNLKDCFVLPKKKQ